MVTAGALLATVAVIGCSTSAPVPTNPGPSAALPTPDLPGQVVPIDDVSLSDDRKTLTVSFIGAPEYEPTSPCAEEYWVEITTRAR